MNSDTDLLGPPSKMTIELVRSECDHIREMFAEFKADSLLRRTAAASVAETAYQTLKELIYTILSSSKEAIDKAESATNKRFDSVNEFRAQLGDILANSASKSETSIRFDAVTARLDRLSTQLDKNSGQNDGGKYAWAGAGVIAGLILSVVAIWAMMHGHP